MSFATTMTALKDKVDGLIANRVAKFAYTQQAYNSDDVNGVTTYDFNNEQNVPTSSASVLKVNETVLTKGWRTQASAITRMLMNHFLGRTSYNLNKTVDFLKAFMLAVENNMGVADGFAQLDSNGILPVSQGGTGKNTYTENAILTGSEDNEIDELETTSGALFATSLHGAPSFGTLPVAQGGTGKTTFTSGNVLIGNGINAISEKAIDTTPIKNSNNLITSGGAFELLLAFASAYIGRQWTATDNYVGNLFSFFGNLIHSNKGYTSEDGITWQSGDFTYVAIKVTETMSVAVHLNTSDSKYYVYYNEGNGWVDTEYEITWAGSHLHNDFNSRIDYNNGTWVISGSRIYYSNNGKTWNQATGSGLVGCGPVAYGNGVWVAVKQIGGGSSGAGLVYSSDGATWSNTNLTSGLYYKVYFADGKFVCCGSNLGIKYSLDGITWSNTNLTSGATCTYGGFHYANGVFVLGCDNGGIKRSLDGITWDTTSASSGSYRTPNYANGVWIVGGTASTGIHYSTDNAITWVQSNIDSSNIFGGVPFYRKGTWLIGGGDTTFYSTITEDMFSLD